MNYKCFSLLFVLSSALASPLDDEHEAITLGSGSQSFAASFFFEKTGLPQGGIILTHGGYHHHIAKNLGLVLSKHGWSVLVFQESQEDSETNALRIAIQYMESQRGLFNLVLLSSGSAWKNVSNFLLQDQGNTQSVKGLVLLNTKELTSMKELDPSLAILDIVTSKSPTISFQNRKIHANRYKLNQYQQLNLHLPLYYKAYGEDKLTRRIRGWLFHNVRGMEIEKSS
ncbi:MAG: DUF3530 family protein [Pseudomonadales bacterium]|nr:DUF3530 family protein [Pseudomonadales bacterium]